MKLFRIKKHSDSFRFRFFTIFILSLLVLVEFFLQISALKKSFKAGIPLTEVVGWLLCSYACVFAAWLDPNGGLNPFSLFAFPIQSWISVLNPLATMFIIKAYRKTLIKIFRQTIGFRSMSSTVAPISTIQSNTKLFTRVKAQGTTEQPSASADSTDNQQHHF